MPLVSEFLYINARVVLSQSLGKDYCRVEYFACYLSPRVIHPLNVAVYVIEEDPLEEMAKDIKRVHVCGPFRTK